eukprot:458011-Hanusia_phi.AAC.2
MQNAQRAGEKQEQKQEGWWKKESAWKEGLHASGELRRRKLSTCCAFSTRGRIHEPRTQSFDVKAQGGERRGAGRGGAGGAGGRGGCDGKGWRQSWGCVGRGRSWLKW